MTKYTLDEIRQAVMELAAKIEAPEAKLPDFGEIRGDAHPTIDIDMSGTMYYLISERGIEYERKRTYRLHNILEWAFIDITFWMASDYELNNRSEDKDCRRMIFAKQEELLGKLDAGWKEKEKDTHNKILLVHPYDDLAHLRAIYCGQLRKQGLSEPDIHKMAYEKYPFKRVV